MHFPSLYGHRSFIETSLTMQLNMALNGVLIASAKIDPSRCKDEYYLQALQRLLFVQNKEIIELIPAKPLYYIEVGSSFPALSFQNKR